MTPTEMWEANKIEIVFGALAPSIAEQLAAAGIKYGVSGKNAVGHFQRDADAIVRLNISGLLPDGQARTLRLKLLRRIVEMVNDLVVARPA